MVGFIFQARGESIRDRNGEGQAVKARQPVGGGLIAGDVHDSHLKQITVYTFSNTLSKTSRTRLSQGKLKASIRNNSMADTSITESINEFLHTVNISCNKNSNDLQSPPRMASSKRQNATPFLANTGWNIEHVNRCSVSHELLGQNGHLIAARSKNRNLCPDEHIRRTS
jgi:hypothetical protein